MRFGVEELQLDVLSFEQRTVVPLLMLDERFAARKDRDGEGCRSGLQHGVEDVTVLFAEGMPEDAQRALVLSQLGVAEREVIRASDDLHLVAAAPLADKQRNVLQRIDGKTAKQRAFRGHQLARRAVEVFHQVHAAMQIQNARGVAGGAVQVKHRVVIEQVVKRLCAMHHRPIGEQVIVGGVDRRVLTQRLTDVCNGRRRHQTPWNVRRANAMDERFLDREVTVARRRRTDRQRRIHPHRHFEAAEDGLEVLGFHGLEQRQLGRAQRLVPGGLRQLEQRVVSEVLPHSEARTVAQQQT